MIVVKKWVAAGSTATLLAGGLFLGAPMASAAPGDAACLQASVQFNAALGAAGIDVAFVSQLEVATAAVVAAAENYDAVSQAAVASQAAVDAEAILAQADKDYEAALTLAAAEQGQYDEALTDAGGDVTAAAVVAAQDELTAALAAQAAALNTAEAAALAYEAAIYTPEVQAAEGALEDASVSADALLSQLSGDEEAAAELIALFKAFLAACEAGAIGVEPVTPVVVPVPVAPVATPVAPTPVAPVTVAPGTVAPTTGTGSGVAAPTGTNKGLNVQTAVASEDDSPAVALLAALLAVGVAVPVATAARMRRLARAQR